MSTRTRHPWKTLSVAIMGVIVLLSGAYGFASRFISFMHEVMSEEGIGPSMIPVLTYLFASAGFLLIFVWAFLRGHFSDIEGPKYAMLERHNAIERGEFHMGAPHHG